MACGRTLSDHGCDFVLCTKEIGGRMLTSQTHEVNYGASYVTADYEHVLPYMGGGSRIRISDCWFLNKRRLTTFYCRETLLSLPRLVALYRVATDYRRRLRRLRRRAVHEQQVDILRSDPVLSRYVRMSATQLVEELGLERLTNAFFGPLFFSTGFAEFEDANAFHYLDNLLSVLCTTYTADHSRCCEELPRGWRDRIVLGTVTDIRREPDGRHVVASSAGYFTARNVVLALPHRDAAQIWRVPGSDRGVPIYVFEVKGERRNLFRDKSVVFFRPREHDITILWRQSTGSDIVFSKLESPALERYYHRHEIVNTVYWPAACVLSDEEWVEQDLGGGLYLASDYNICGLEDAFITGFYAANRIIETST